MSCMCQDDQKGAHVAAEAGMYGAGTAVYFDGLLVWQEPAGCTAASLAYPLRRSAARCSYTCSYYPGVCLQCCQK